MGAWATAHALFLTEGGGLRIANAAPQFSTIAGAGKALSGEAEKRWSAQAQWQHSQSALGSRPPRFSSGKVALAFRFKLNSSHGTNSWQIFGDDSDGAAGSLYVYFQRHHNRAKTGIFRQRWHRTGGYTSRDFGSTSASGSMCIAEWDGATGWRIGSMASMTTRHLPQPGSAQHIPVTVDL